MSVAEFWRHNVPAHQRPGKRWLHRVGTLSGMGLCIAAIALFD